VPSTDALAPPVRPLPEGQQEEVTRLCADTSVLLMQHGAESALVESLTRRLGLALGADRVEAGVFANSIVLTTLSGSRDVTVVRRSEDRGISMHWVTEVQRAVLAVEAGELDAAAYRARLDAVVPLRYPRWLVALAIGLSCACFARLAGADWTGCGLVVVASGVAQFLRMRIARLHFNPVVNFFVTAFVATSIADLGRVWSLGRTPQIAVASSVLLLVPGFPLINGVSDLVKGYMSTGIARLTYALLLLVAASAGVVLSMTLFDRLLP